MSIIYEALNKAQNKENNNPHPILEKTQPPIKHNKLPKRRSIFLTLLLLFIIGAIAVKYTTMPKNVPNRVTKNEQIKTRTDENNLPQNIAKNEEFYLSGISFTDNIPLAIINDDIVTVGDVVKGAKVIDIKENSVELENQGEKFILSMR